MLGREGMKIGHFGIALTEYFPKERSRQKRPHDRESMKPWVARANLATGLSTLDCCNEKVENL